MDRRNKAMLQVIDSVCESDSKSPEEVEQPSSEESKNELDGDLLQQPEIDREPSSGDESDVGDDAEDLIQHQVQIASLINLMQKEEPLDEQLELEDFEEISRTAKRAKILLMEINAAHCNEISNKVCQRIYVDDVINAKGHKLLRKNQLVSID